MRAKVVLTNDELRRALGFHEDVTIRYCFVTYDPDRVQLAIDIGDDVLLSSELRDRIADSQGRDTESVIVSMHDLKQ
jgi:hypothetical protein